METAHKMTKDDARDEVLRRWAFLPDDLRQSYEAAETFAQQMAATLNFESITDREQLIAAWIIREINREAAAIERAA